MLNQEVIARDNYISDLLQQVQALEQDAGTSKACAESKQSHFSDIEELLAARDGLVTVR